MVFRMTMHPALDGDCVQLSWGETGDLHNLFVDLGRGKTWASVRPVLAGLAEIELFVMSHVDADHIAGALPMVREDAPAFKPKRLWYNARPQLEEAHHRLRRIEPFGPRQGEKLSRGISKFGWPQNTEFASGVVSTGSPEAGDPIALPGGLTLRLLSPGDRELADLLPVWDRDLERAGIRTFDPDKDDDPLDDIFEPLSGAPDVESLASVAYKKDEAEANGASIAFVAEFGGKRALLAADAHSEVLEAALRPLADAEGGTYRLDLLKVCHHGSKANTSPDFFEMIDCTRFAFSTNGTRKHKHPDAETIARLLKADPDRDKVLYFNYDQPSAKLWRSLLLSKLWSYQTVFPKTGQDGLLCIDID